MEWISVKHSLPEDGADKLLLVQAVMVFNKYSDKKIIDEFIVIGKFEYIEWYIKTMSDYTPFDDFGYIEEAGSGIVYRITHWMDLPELPKEEEHESI